MKIKALYVDNYLSDGVITDEEYQLKEKKISEFINKSKTNDNVYYNTKNNYIYFINGSENELDYNNYNDIIDVCNMTTASEDWIEISGITFNRVDCISILEEKLNNNDFEIVDFVKHVFKTNECNKYMFEYRLLDLCFKDLIDKKISELNNIKNSINNDIRIDWR